MKLRCRLRARELRIPVVMEANDRGDAGRRAVRPRTRPAHPARSARGSRSQSRGRAEDQRGEGADHHADGGREHDVGQAPGVAAGGGGVDRVLAAAGVRRGGGRGAGHQHRAENLARSAAATPVATSWISSSWSPTGAAAGGRDGAAGGGRAESAGARRARAATRQGEPERSRWSRASSTSCSPPRRWRRAAGTSSRGGGWRRARAYRAARRPFRRRVAQLSRDGAAPRAGRGGRRKFVLRAHQVGLRVKILPGDEDVGPSCSCGSSSRTRLPKVWSRATPGTTRSRRRSRAGTPTGASSRRRRCPPGRWPRSSDAVASLPGCRLESSRTRPGWRSWRTSRRAPSA